jgi:hypothetical protein
MIQQILAGMDGRGLKIERQESRKEGKACAEGTEFAEKRKA